MSLLTITICEAKGTTATCPNLAKVNDIDDLLFQFYSNLDNQCLFEMPTEELEKIWGIRVLDYVNRSYDEKDILNREYQRIRKNEDGFFVSKRNYEHGISAFDISLTDRYIDKNKGWGSSVGKGQFPKLLPPPQIVNDFFDFPYVEDFHVSLSGKIALLVIPKDTVYHKNSQYFWLNKSLSDHQPVLFIRAGFLPKPGSITLYSEARILDFK